MDTEILYEELTWKRYEIMNMVMRSNVALDNKEVETTILVK